MARRASVLGDDHFDVADERDEVRTEDADDRERLAVENDRPADRVHRSAEAALPHAVADERHGARLVVMLERPPELDLRAGYVEIVGGHAHRRNALGLAAPGQIRAPPEHRHETVERPGRAAEIVDVGQRERLPIGAGADDREGDQAFGVGERQRPDENGIDEREHRRVGADRQRQDGDDADRVRRLARQPPHRVPQFRVDHDAAYARAGLH